MEFSDCLKIQRKIEVRAVLMVWYRITTMARHLTARKVEEVSRTATVSDYDELPEDQQAAVRRLAAGESVERESIPDSDIVRYTDYYRIDSAGAQASD
jgi:hypothetical protein